jgi:SAM-dependent methyltransferase
LDRNDSQIDLSDMLPNPIAQSLRRRGRAAFIASLPQRAKVLDVGCGNDSPRYFKHVRGDIYYIGLDVGDYNQSAQERADEYRLAPPESFAALVAGYENQVDAVVSAHNIEHCDSPEEVMEAILKAPGNNGRIYMSFPCEQSVSFPKRRGTLNFFDDSTHRMVPNWQNILRAIQRRGFRIDFAAQRYRPLLLRMIGGLVEPVSAGSARVLPGTWELYGFESVIWATRIA